MWLYLIPGGLLLTLLWANRAAAASDPNGFDAMTDTPDTIDPNANLPRGIRNNNPFNLRPGSPWQGIAGIDNGPAGAYLQFETPEAGLRAGFKNLRNQSLLHGLNTVRGVITRYAPASDNNATDAYIADVARRLGVAPDDVLDFDSNPVTLRNFGAAIIQHENGMQPYDVATLDTGAAEALA